MTAATMTVLAGYQAWMIAVGRTPVTVDQRLKMARRVLGVWPDLHDVTTTDLILWLGGMTHLSRASRAKYHHDLRDFFGWLHATGHLEADPTDSSMFVSPRVPHGVPRPLTQDEEARALETAQGRHVRAWLLLSLRAGLRASEAAAMRGEQITDEFIRVVGKGGVEAVIPTHPELWDLAQTYPRRGYWFPGQRGRPHVSSGRVSRAVTAHFRTIGIDAGSLHRGRHAFATSLLNRGANMRQVQTLMRHSSPATTAIYTAVTDDGLRDVVRLLGGTR